ncbi:MAG: hypothetical protein O9327_13205, partial [Polaromonas sp.]|nr:hypothetical protein [Polaromonas sp.]
GLWMAYTTRELQISGAMGVTIKQVAVGSIILGFAHLIETLMFHLLNLPSDINELVHRVIILIGFVFITNGLRRLAVSLRAIAKTWTTS